MGIRARARHAGQRDRDRSRRTVSACRVCHVRINVRGRPARVREKMKRHPRTLHRVDPLAARRSRRQRGAVHFADKRAGYVRYYLSIT